jgi:uncharacterized phage-associated protein
MIEDTQVTVIDVASYILQKQGPMTTMKLQKLCYYSQMWHSYFLKKKLFKEDVQAWSYGPVTYELFDIHKGKYQISYEELQSSRSSALDADASAVIDQVLIAYGGLTGAQLSDLSHSESPWILSRERASTAGPSPVISIESMIDFAKSKIAG